LSRRLQLAGLLQAEATHKIWPFHLGRNNIGFLAGSPSRASRRDQAFLMCTSVLDTLTGGLCDAVTEGTNNMSGW
jgi:hypothetical protein